MTPKMALLRVYESDANVEAVAVISEPDAQGFVQINRMVHGGPDGPTDRWCIDRLYKFDGELMDRVNTLANRASDAKAAAIQVLNIEGTFMYTADDAMAVQLMNMDPDHYPVQ